jgi:hypothetical protein
MAAKVAARRSAGRVGRAEKRPGGPRRGGPPVLPVIQAGRATAAASRSGTLMDTDLSLSPGLAEAARGLRQSAHVLSRRMSGEHGDCPCDHARPPGFRRAFAGQRARRGETRRMEWR